MSAIVSASLRAIYDSRGRETVEATVTAEGGHVGRAGAPSGASTGRHEVRAFPPGGVPAALARFHSGLEGRLLGMENDPSLVDALLHEVDGTPDFSVVGGNVATAVSIATAVSRAAETGVPLWRTVRRAGVEGGHFPAVVGNCLNGGRHAIGGPDIQEFLAFSPAPKPADAVRAAIAVHAAVGETLQRKYPKHALGRGDEGGWVAPVGNLEALEILVGACQEVTDRLHVPVHPALDLAASEFYRDGKYRYKEQTLDDEGQLGFLTGLVDRFGLRYVEDPFDQEAFDLSARFTQAVGSRTLVVGDDLYTTSTERLRRGVERRSTNSILIKVNQVGTLTDTLRTVDEARRHGVSTITSHRSGDLPEGWLAHLAVGFGSAGLKCGLLGGERVAKLNELLRLGAATGTTE
ncbi:MAG TPA: enolase [Thermoplasmata archaeon]|nr:enolase [Thermoplasmata archaeon]